MENMTVADFVAMMCDPDSVKEMLNSLDFDVGKFAYDGFDAEKVSSAFTKNANEAGIEGTQLEQDLADIVLVGLSKGNLREDQFDKFEPVPKSRLEELKNRYKIKTKTQKGQQISTSSDSMTFARSVLVFPMVASDLIRKGLYTPKPTRNLMFSNELPAVFKHSGFPALIPKRNKVGSVYLYAYLGYQIEFSSKINRSSRKSVKEKMDEQYGFASKAWQGKLIGMEERVEVMKKYEINTRGVLETCLKVANKLLSEVGKEIFDTKKIMETYVDANDVVDFELVEQGDDGFDAEKISSEFTKNASEAGIEGTQLEQDIAYIVLVGLSKGNLRQDQFDELKRVHKIRLQELKNRYKIETKTRRGQRISTSNDSMTFARSVLVFPMVASDLIKRGLYIPKPTQNLLFSNELPAVFKHSGFPSLIPKRNQVGSVYFHAVLAYQIEFYSEINPTFSRKSLKEKFDEQYGFASKGWEGKFIGFEQRVELMKKYEINSRRVLETCLKVANKLLSDIGKETFDTKKIMETYVDGNDVVDFELVEQGDDE